MMTFFQGLDPGLHTSQKYFFPEEPHYWEPKSDVNAIYEQLAMKYYREILRQKIKSVTMLNNIINFCFIELLCILDLASLAQ